MYPKVKVLKCTKYYNIDNEPLVEARNLTIFKINFKAERNSKNAQKCALGELEIQLKGTNGTILMLWYNMGAIRISYNLEKFH